jgi:hypothetical protein
VAVQVERRAFPALSGIEAVLTPDMTMPLLATAAG